MALTKIRGEQIHDRQLKQHHFIDTNDGGAAADRLIYTQLNLDNSLVATDLDESSYSLSSTDSVHGAVLDSKLIALWDIVLNQSVSGSSATVTTEVESAAATTTPTVSADGKGVLTTGSGANGSGTENYKVQIRDSATKDPVTDGSNAAVYGELTNTDVSSGGDYELSFYDSSGSPFEMGVQQVSTITTLGDTSDSLNNKYFNLNTPEGEYYVWYNTSSTTGQGDPAVAGRTGVEVQISQDDTADDVATATRSALSSEITEISVSGTGNNVEVTNNTAGRVDGPTDGSGTDETRFSFDVNTLGTPSSVDFMFAEVFSYLDAPDLSFITGVGFADVVGVSGSHNHNDLYYTKVQLESGQLDDRYYTQTELAGGAIDTRYTPTSEIDPNPGDDTGTGILDSRYFKQSTLESTDSGSSGASIIGFSSEGNLSATNVQGALIELQGDIDDITSGNLNITHSLDDAYNDGSVIIVDGADADGTAVSGKDRMDFQLDDEQKFVVSDSGGTNELFDVTVDSTNGNFVEVTNADFNVDGTSTFTGEFNQQTGAITFNAGGSNKFDVDAGNVTIDGQAASSINVTDAKLDIKTTNNTAGGNLNITSSLELNLKDQHLAAALPFSDAGNTGLSGNLDATSLVGAVNENADDLYTLINTTLPANTDSASGADQIGVTGITGVIPGGAGSGNSPGDDGTVQEMLEGIMQSAGGVKTYDDEAALVSDKQSGSYLPVDTMFYLKSNDRFGIILVESTDAVEGTDWDYLWGANQPLGGANLTVVSDTFVVDSTGAIDLDGDTLDVDASGAHLGFTTDGKVNLDSANGQMVQITSDTEVEVTTDGTLDFDANTITMDGKLTATGATDDHMVVTTSGTGEIRLSSSMQIDLNAPTIDVHGDIDVAANKQINVDKLNITSVDGDSEDFATITGERTGTVNSLNLLENSGFESGSGTDATSWTEATGAERSTSEKFYDNASLHYNQTGVTGDNDIATQSVTGLNLDTHIISFWAKGTSPNSSISVVLNGSTPVEVVPAGSLTSTFTRYSAEVTPSTADGDLLLSINHSDVDDDPSVYFDAVMLEEGTGSPSDYFSDYRSTLLFTIGNNADDSINFRSDDGAGTATDLVRINRSTVEILGDLQVTGTQTIVNSTEVDIGDNEITLNANVTGSPSLDASFVVERGDENNTALRWNETDDQWEITYLDASDGSVVNSYPIVTANGSNALSMDSAYDGGSEVSVDDTNVTWTLDASKKFTIADSTDSNKFVVNEGSGASSVRIDTTGGVDINVDAGFSLLDDVGGGSLDISDSFTLTGYNASSVTVDGTEENLTLEVKDTSASNPGNINLASNEGDVVVTGEDFDVSTSTTTVSNSDGFTIDGQSSSTLSATDADLNLSTLGSTTPSNLKLSSVADITFNDQYQTSSVALSQTGADGFVAEFAYDAQTDFDWNNRPTSTDTITSLLGATNANRKDLWHYVELLATQGAAIGTAAGSNLIGVAGIPGVTPSGRNSGEDSNLQEMLEGIGQTAGGGKRYATLTDFTNAKASGTEFMVNEHVWILDINRQVRVFTTSVGIVEGTDWAFLGGSDLPVSGNQYQFSLSNAEVDSFQVTTAGGVDINANGSTNGSISLNSSASSNFTVNGDTLTLETTTSGNIELQSAGNVVTTGATFDIDVTKFDLDATGAVQMKGGMASDFIVDADIGSGNDTNVLTIRTLDSANGNSGNILLESGSDVNITATDVDIDSTSFNLDTTGQFSLDGVGDSNVSTADGNLTVGVGGSSGELRFKDRRQTTSIPLTDSSNSSLEHDSGTTAPASIYDAINRAYKNTGEVSKTAYFEKNVTMDDETNDYVVIGGASVSGGISDDYLPGYENSGNKEFSPSALRAPQGSMNESYHIAVYLNGLRLNDSEWVYWYDDTSGEERHMISFVTDIDGHEYYEVFTTVASSDVVLSGGDDVIIVEVTYNASSNT